MDATLQLPAADHVHLHELLRGFSLFGHEVSRDGSVNITLSDPHIMAYPGHSLALLRFVEDETEPKRRPRNHRMACCSSGSFANAHVVATASSVYLQGEPTGIDQRLDQTNGVLAEVDGHGQHDLLPLGCAGSYH